MTYNPTNTDEVKRRMDDEYQRGVAYVSELPFDRVRAVEIRSGILRMAQHQKQLGGTLLDLGCGEGGAASYWPHQRIVGVEISDVACQKARAAYPLPTFVCAPVETFELPEGTPEISCVVGSEAIEHWCEPGPALDNVRRQVQEGTTLILSTPNRDSLHVRMHELEFGLGEAPTCSYDHVHEYGYNELIEFVTAHGWDFKASRGAMFEPAWACEAALGGAYRRSSDYSEQFNTWMADIGRTAAPEYCFCVVYKFEAR
jgi:SAM-dependent methyltransferase